MPKRLSLLLALLTLSAACAEQVESNEEICEKATTHVQACFPQETQSGPVSCDPAMAEEMLSSDCDELQAQVEAAEGAADGFCNPFFWWMCSSSPSADEPEVASYSFNLGINVCETSTCVEDLFGEITWGGACGKITLEDANGQIVAVDYVNARLPNGGVHTTGGGFRDLDLSPGEYRARLWRRDGEPAQNVEGVPAELKVVLEENGDVTRERSNFKILKSEAEAIRACVDGIGTLRSTCEGELQDEETTEWTWIIHIEGTHAEGTYENLNRSRFTYQIGANAFRFPLLRAGDYKVTFHEVDIWSSYTRREMLNADFEDYQELIERYETGLKLESEFALTDEDIAGGESVNVLNVNLESRVCE